MWNFFILLLFLFFHKWAISSHIPKKICTPKYKFNPVVSDSNAIIGVEWNIGIIWMTPVLNLHNLHDQRMKALLNMWTQRLFCDKIASIHKRIFPSPLKGGIIRYDLIYMCYTVIQALSLSREREQMEGHWYKTPTYSLLAQALWIKGNLFFEQSLS